MAEAAQLTDHVLVMFSLPAPKLSCCRAQRDDDTPSAAKAPSSRIEIRGGAGFALRDDFDFSEYFGPDTFVDGAKEVFSLFCFPFSFHLLY